MNEDLSFRQQAERGAENDADEAEAEIGALANSLLDDAEGLIFVGLPIGDRMASKVERIKDLIRIIRKARSEAVYQRFREAEDSTHNMMRAALEGIRIGSRNSTTHNAEHEDQR